MHQLCVAAGVGDFSGPLLILFGLVSLAVAAVFILRQSDMKRMLAYSSVEHMGIQALGVGLGGAGVFGAMLHAVNHSVTKAALFLTAGNILAYFGRKRIDEVTGMTRVLPVFFDFREHPGPWPDAPEGRSRREILARSRGLRIFRGLGTRRDDLDPAAARKQAETLPLPTFRSRGPWCELDAAEETRPRSHRR